MSASSTADPLPSNPDLDASHRPARLAAIGAPLVDWLVGAALPRWSTTGVDRVRGGFFEKIGLDDGVPIEAPRRARVVARQIYVFATAQKNGWLPGADRLVDHGLEFLFDRLKLPGGTFAAAVAADGTARNDAFDLYEHAFVLFALAAASRDGTRRDRLAREAEALLDGMVERWRHPRRGFEEGAPRTLPLKSNPHMHLLEAALAWADIAEGAAKARWTALVDELVELCLDRFIDAGGALREYFDGDWQPAAGPAGRIVEPGHQFEWAWLLMRSADTAGSPRRLSAAARLLGIGETHGVDPARGVAVNELDAAFAVTDATAKLWPQTERIKAWHLAALTGDVRGAATAEAALQRAVVGLQRYFVASPAGLWHEQLAPDGRFASRECRASSLYHIVCAIDAVHGGCAAAAITPGGRTS